MVAPAWMTRAWHAKWSITSLRPIADSIFDILWYQFKFEIQKSSIKEFSYNFYISSEHLIYVFSLMFLSNIKTYNKINEKLIGVILLQQISIMKSALLLAICIIALSANPHPHLDPIVSHVPKTYKVNLEDSPEVRWGPIIKDYAQPLKKFMFYFDLIPFTKTFFDGIDWFARNEFKYKDFVTEVDAISKLSGYSFERIFFINFMYEYSTIKACSGIIVRNDEGRIIHGRNLDFSMWELLAGLAARIEYYKGGKLMYSSDSIVGSVFTLTAHKPGAFSIEVNTRYEARFEDDFISVLMKNDIPTCWLVKKVVDEESTYAGALQRLKTEKIGAPVYFVISGTKGNEGAVIERDSEKVHGFYELSDSNWFLVQTNYDRDQPDPVHDQRRLPAEDRLKKRGNKGLNEQNLLDQVLFKFPTLNLETILTAVMVSATNYHNTTVWYGDNPVTLSKNLVAQ